MSQVESPAARAAKDIVERRKPAKPSPDLPCHGCGGPIALMDWARGKRRRCLKSQRWEDNCYLGEARAVSEAPPVSPPKVRVEKPAEAKPEQTPQVVQIVELPPTREPQGPASPRLREILYQAIVALEAEKSHISETIAQLKEMAK